MMKSRAFFFRQMGGAALSLVCTLGVSTIHANPAGGNVVSGAATINSGINATINQSTASAIIEWTSFSVNSNESVTFSVPTNGATLNRVIGADPSTIAGSVTSNGSLILINTNGIVVANGGRIDTAGLLNLSTLDVDNDEFLNGGSMTFRGSGEAGVENNGTLTSAAGDLLLLGGLVKNSGTINADAGTVALGAGSEIIVNQTANGGLISVVAASPSTGTGIENTSTGTISGAAAELKTHGNVFALAIQNDGVVRATGAQTINGRVQLVSSGGSSSINLGGNSRIGSVNANGSDGSIDIFSDGGTVNVGSSTAIERNEAGSTATISVAVPGDDKGGGSIEVDGAGNVVADRSGPNVQVTTSNGTISVAPGVADAGNENGAAFTTFASADSEPVVNEGELAVPIDADDFVPSNEPNANTGDVLITSDDVSSLNSVIVNLPTTTGGREQFQLVSDELLAFISKFDGFDRYQVFLENGYTGEMDELYQTIGTFETYSGEAVEIKRFEMENRLDELVGPRRNSYTLEEIAEERNALRARARRGVGNSGHSYYVYNPGTNRYSSYRVFGVPLTEFYPIY